MDIERMAKALWAYEGNPDGCWEAVDGEPRDRLLAKAEALLGFVFPMSVERGCDVSGEGDAHDDSGQLAPAQIASELRAYIVSAQRGSKTTLDILRDLADRLDQQEEET